MPIPPLSFDLVIKNKALYFDEYLLDYPLEINTRDLGKLEEYRLHLLTMPNGAENDIYALKYEDKRVGWAIPVQALCSNQHALAEDEHFLPCALVAAALLLKYLEDPDFQVPSIDPLPLGELFHQDAVAFLLYKPNLPQAFEVKRLTAYLFRHGYIEYQDPARKPEPSNLSNERSGKTLNLKLMASTLGPVDFIHTIFADTLPYERNNVTRFFLLYQIVEILMSKIFQYQYSQIIPQLSQAGLDPIRIKDIIADVSAAAKEKERIKGLFQAGIIEDSTKKNLQDAANRLLVKLDLAEEDDAALAFYRVRNKVFHQFSVFASDEMLWDVNKCLIPAVIDLLIGYDDAKITMKNSEASSGT